MVPKISKVTEINQTLSNAVLFHDIKQLESVNVSSQMLAYIARKTEKANNVVVYNYPELFFFGKTDAAKKMMLQLEEVRKLGATLFETLKYEGITKVGITNFSSKHLTFHFIEGLLLAGYSFTKYKKEKNDFWVEEIFVKDDELTDEQIDELTCLTEAVMLARDLVNEPLSSLNAEGLSQQFVKMGELSGFGTEVFGKNKIESLKMGGLIAVNKGSIDPPTFNVLEWKPDGHINKRPFVLIGKGIVFDTGGLSLKPTAKSMDYMKSDMAGGAVAASVIYAVARMKKPLWVIGLIPATDNRPDGNAYAPGDVITIYGGTTVEIKNTDAEGRLILADALDYAKKYNPLLVIDIATLTGSADIIAGSQALIAMGNSSEHIDLLKHTGNETYERVIDLPLWDEYVKPLKSEIADLNNTGAREGQTAIAGKFLEHFTDYPWVHLDIAGVAFSFEKDGYKPMGGTGFGVRLLYNFLKKFN